jgi:beta-lactamase regulating signal transducer with metallopeptidase domain
MAELLFPVSAVLVTFALLIPALTLLSQAALARARRRAGSWAEFGSDTTYAWLVAPTLLPMAWLLSSALHQTEPDQAPANCLIDHATATTCLDAIALVTLLLGGGALLVARRLWVERSRLRLDPLDSFDPLAQRVAAIATSDARLRRLRVRVLRHGPAPVLTAGRLNPRVYLDACFVRDSDDAVLRSALLHELVHVRDRDTLRGFAGRLLLAMNPAAARLQPDFERWREAREALCDGEAVALGGEPLALAQGIVRAARFRCAGLGACGAALLGGPERSPLHLRLALLLDGPPRPRPSRGHLGLVLALAAVVVVPHVPTADLLEHFHYAVEALVHHN